MLQIQIQGRLEEEAMQVPQHKAWAVGGEEEWHVPGLGSGALSHNARPHARPDCEAQMRYERMLLLSVQKEMEEESVLVPRSQRGNVVKKK